MGLEGGKPVLGPRFWSGSQRLKAVLLPRAGWEYRTGPGPFVSILGERGMPTEGGRKYQRGRLLRRLATHGDGGTSSCGGGGLGRRWEAGMADYNFLLARA